MASAILLVVTEFLMFFFLVLGYMIRFKKRADLITGSKKMKIRDREGLTRLVGNSLLILAAAAFMTFSGLLLYPESEVEVFLLFTALIVPVVGFYAAVKSRSFIEG